MRQDREQNSGEGSRTCLEATKGTCQKEGKAGMSDSKQLQHLSDVLDARGMDSKVSSDLLKAAMKAAMDAGVDVRDLLMFLTENIEMSEFLPALF